MRPDGNGVYTTLQPRQAVRPAPEALRAASAPWSGLAGTPAGFSDDIENDNGGHITGLSAGTGLSGGGLSGSVTLNIANGGVGAAQIDSAQVQARVVGSCPLATYLRGINADGSALCSDLPGSTPSPRWTIRRTS